MAKVQNEWTLKDVESLEQKSLHLIPSKEQRVKIEEIQIHPEWQPRLKTDPSRLFNPICLDGLATPPKVWKDLEGKFHALDGRHRWSALKKIQEERPDVWKRHQFDKGIPCKVYENLTEDQVLDLRTDEGRGQEPLVGKVEAWRALKPHYNNGRTDKQIEASYWKVFADTCCSPGKASELLQAFGECKSMSDFLEKVHNATYVHQMRFRALFNCPNVVEDAWIKGELGQLDEANVPFPRINDKDLRNLAKAFKADIAADEAHGFDLNYTKENPGPNFNQEWDKLLAEKANKSNGSDQEQKPMTKQERENRIANAKSGTEKLIFAAIGGNEMAKGQLDRIFAIIAQLDKAMAIDTDFMVEIMKCVIERGKKLSDEERMAIYDIVKTPAK